MECSIPLLLASNAEEHLVECLRLAPSHILSSRGGLPRMAERIRPCTLFEACLPAANFAALAPIPPKALLAKELVGILLELDLQ